MLFFLKLQVSHASYSAKARKHNDKILCNMIKSVFLGTENIDL